MFYLSKICYIKTKVSAVTRSVPSVSEYSFYTDCKLTGISLYKGQCFVRFVSLDPAVFILNMWKGLFDFKLSVTVHFVSLFKSVFFRC